MVSATSSSKYRGWFNPTLFRKNMTRFWPIWAVYTAVLAFLLPVELFLYSARTHSHTVENVRNILRMATVAMPVVGLLFGAVTAIALFSYLMDHRAVQLYHSLPIRREGLFLTNWLTGLCFFLVPNLILYLISLVIELGMGTPDLTGLGLWLVTATVCPMFFFCFAVCVAMFTGHILALPVFYGILNVLVIGMCSLMDFAGEVLLYNYNGHLLGSSDPARWCTPVYQLIHLLDRGEGIQLNGVMAVSGYCVVLGAVFTCIALGLYRLRQLERAGDVVTVGWVRPVFQYGLGVCVGLLFGLVLYINFFYSFSPVVYILITALCAVIGAFAGRMLLKKTLRVFAEGWKGCFALGLAVLAVMFAVRADFMGFQRWTPDPDKVASVYVYGLRTYPDDDGRYFDLRLDDPEDIRRVVELHKALNADMDALRAFKEEDGYYAAWDEDGRYQTMDTKRVYLSYTMADGSEVYRWYDPVPVWAEDLDDPATYAGQLNALLNDPDLMRTTYWEYFRGDLKATGGWITRAAMTEEEWETLVKIRESEDVELVASAQSAVVTDSDDLTFTADAAQVIWKAFQEDLAAGRVRRYLLDDEERQENCYVSDINISLSWTYVDEQGDRSTQSWDFTFTPQKSQTSVMAALEKLGLKEALRERTFDYEPE